MVIASTIMLFTNVLIELIFEGNIASLQSNPIKTLFTALILGIAIVIAPMAGAKQVQKTVGIGIVADPAGAKNLGQGFLLAVLQEYIALFIDQGCLNTENLFPQ